jgi:hypothetical protein
LTSITEIAPTIGGENLLKFSEKESAEFDAYLKPKIETYLQNHPDDWNNRTAILGWLWKVFVLNNIMVL